VVTRQSGQGVGEQPNAPEPQLPTGIADAAAPLQRRRRPTLWMILIAAPVALLALSALSRHLLVEAFKVPSGAMYPSVAIGDHLFVTKGTYGIFSKSAPRRGDIVVFEYPDPDPERPRVDYIKRVIALPGDRLEVHGGVPIINGWQVPRCRVGEARVTIGGDATELEVFVEFLEERSYLVAQELGLAAERQGPFRVAAGEFWVLGDNRDNSSDSRFWHAGRGAGVPFASLHGRASLVWLPRERFGIDLSARPALPRDLKVLQPELDRCLQTLPSLAARTPPPPR
jgi:signal peptidase I